MSTLGPYELDSIITGDARVLGTMVPDASVDCIFTDPPYLKEYIPLYGWLAEFAARALKPTGFLMAYSGQYWKDEVMALFRPHLEYFWDFTLRNSGNSPILWQRKIISRNKSILCYRPKGGTGIPRFNVISDYDGGGEDKRYHKWGQDAQSARYYIECFTGPGQIVLDPCMGGGTTAYVCGQLKRPYLGFEIDPEVAARARARLDNVQPLLFVLQPEQLPMFAADGERRG